MAFTVYDEPTPLPKVGNPKDFASTYEPHIASAAEQLGVSPRVLAAQFGLETGWGRNVIPGTNNLGNIKDFSGGGVAATDSMTGSRDRYRRYDSPDQFAADFVNLIKTRYPNAVGAGDDPQKFATALKAGGYAEDPNYVRKVTAAHGMVPAQQKGKFTIYDDPDAPDFADVKGSVAQPPLTRTTKVLKGAKDTLDAGAQLLYNAMPSSVRDAGDTFNNYLADKTGLVDRLPERNMSSVVTGAKTGLNGAIANDEVAYQARRADSGESGFDGYRTIGNVASSLPVAAALPASAPTLAGRIGLGVASGALGGALQPVTQGDFWSEKAKQVAIGSALGGAVPTVGSAAARVISPNASKNVELNLLKDAGVNPTIGQTLGGAANRIEEKLQSLPIMGDSITAARRRAVEDFNKATINKAIAPVGASVDEAGTAGVSKAAGAVSDAYTAALNKLGGVKFDGKFAQEIGSLSQLAQNLTPDMAKKFTNTLRERVIGRMSPSGGMQAQTFKNVDSELGKIASDYGKSAVASEREFAGAIKELQASIRSQAGRVSTAYREGVKPADLAFAQMVRVENAAKKGALKDGMFTPGQLMMAVREGDKSARKSATARGDALLQDWASAGQNVLGNKYPDSGTAGRMLLGVGGLATGAMNPAIPAGLIAGAGAYSAPAQRLANLLASSRPEGSKAIADFVRNNSPRLATSGAVLGNSFADK